MRYVSLHHHSTFSYLDGFQLPDAHIRRAADLDMASMALTEHGNVSSHVKLEKAALAAGVKPIYGCELYCGAVDTEHRTQRKNHLTVIAATQEGYRNLLSLVSQGWSNYYYEPTVDGAMLERHKRGLIILSGCTGSLLATSLVGGKNVAVENASYQRAKNVARRFKRTFGDAYYLEVQAFPELEVTRKINAAYERMGKELGIELAATGDVHYTKPEESEVQMILHNVGGGGRKTLEEQAREWGYEVPLCPPTTDRSMYDRLRGTGLSKQAAIDAVVNTEIIASRCNVELPKLSRVRYPIEVNATTNETWKQWIRDGWAFRDVDDLPLKSRREYVERLKYEMSVIEEKDFVDYFLVVSDVVRYAKDNGIPVGPARGSAAASLVCWLLRITEVNPMQFPNLVFERFIDINRMDLPDIDLDFDDERRADVRTYLVKKYGVERVSSIGTFTQYRAKNSLDDVARVYKIPAFEVNKIKEVLIERGRGDLRPNDTIEDTANQFEAAKEVFKRFPDLLQATELEGNVKGMGVHAAGLVVSTEPLTDVAAVYAREVAGKLTEVISLDKYDAEYLNVLKIDVLGLSTMGMIRIALEMIRMEPQKLYDIALDDDTVIDAFRRNDTIGIFQFDGRAMRGVNNQLRPDNFQEICDANALVRPGPLHSGAVSRYIDHKNGKGEVSAHPLLEDIVKHTNGQIIYQEQIIRIVMEIGNFNWTEAAYIRKIVSKSLGEQEFQRQWAKFWTGAKANGLTKDAAKSIWEKCITAGSYAFNAAHCVSYGMLAYWCMYLKQKHPVAFYTAALRKMPEDKQLDLLQDAVRHGIKIFEPNPQSSNVTWSGNIATRTITAGFSQIPGIGEKMAQAIIDYRSDWLQNATHPDLDWQGLVNVKGIGQKTVDKIVEFAETDDPFRIHWLERRVRRVTTDIARGDLGPEIPWPDHTAEEIPSDRGRDVEVVWLGQINGKSLRELFEHHLRRKGEVLDPATVQNPELNEWVVLYGADGTENVTITIDRWKYPRYRNAVWRITENDLVLVHGIKPGFMSNRFIKATDIWVIDPDD